MPGLSLISSDFVINVDRSLNQTNAHILQRSDGSALVYWTAAGQADPIQGRLITATGGLIGNPFNASLDIGFNVGSGSITAADLPNGGFVLSSSTGNNVQSVTYDGTGLEGPSSVSTLDVTVSGGLVSETTSDGRVATFISTSAGELASFGTATSPNFDDLSLNNGTQTSTKDQSGSPWNVIDAAGIGSTAMALATARNGGTLIDLHIVSATTLSDVSGPISVALGANYAVGSFKLTEMSSGNFLASWRDGQLLDAQQYNAQGQKVGPLMQVSASGPNHVSVTALPDGHVLMVWDNTNNDAYGYDIWGQLFTASGTTEGGRFLVDNNFVGDQTDPSAAVLADGDIIVVYNSATASSQHTVARILSQTRPDAVDDVLKVHAGQNTTLNVLGNDHDPNGESITIQSTTAPAHGTATLTNGVITYTPTAGYAGPDAFTYKVVDSHGGVDTAAVYITVSPPAFEPGTFELAAFGYGADAGGWKSESQYPRMLADVNGDGRADMVGFGEGGVYVALANPDGSFAPSVLARTEFGAGTSAGGWISDDRYPREMADVNGDGRADIVGFGENGVFVALAKPDGTFAPSVFAVAQWGASANSGGWSSNTLFHRTMADMNGDGRADIVGFGQAGVYVSLGNADGTFAPAFLASNQFGTGASAGGWSSDDRYPRILADVNGDHRADIIGFGESGVVVALAQADGTFAAPIMASSEFGAGSSAGGWSSDNTFHREVADVSGDGKADIVGFGSAGVFIAYGNGDGTFQASTLDIHAFGFGTEGGGWSSQDQYPRMLADVNGDGHADIIGLGNAGVYVALANL